jgi:hypothetical protein
MQSKQWRGTRRGAATPNVRACEIGAEGHIREHSRAFANNREPSMLT